MKRIAYRVGFETERDNMFRKMMIGVMLFLLVGACFAGAKVNADKNSETVKYSPKLKAGEKAAESTGEKTYAPASVEKIVSVQKGFIFHCDVKDWPAVVGENIGIRINGIATPMIVAEMAGPNPFFELQAKKFLESTLGNAKVIGLENIRRGQTFSLIADVKVDGKGLAESLIENGLARRYVAEEEKAEKLQSAVKRTKPMLAVSPKKTAKKKSWYVASKNSKVFHRPGCSFVRRISEDNIVKFTSKEKALQTGRRACKTCSP